MKITAVSRSYIYGLTCIGSLFGLLIFLFSSSPETVGFLGTTVPLIFTWIFLASLGKAILHVFNKSHSPLLNAAVFVIPSVAVLSMMFSALGSISVLEGLLLFVLAALGNFYLSRTWPK